MPPFPCHRCGTTDRPRLLHHQRLTCTACWPPTWTADLCRGCPCDHDPPTCPALTDPSRCHVLNLALGLNPLRRA